MSSMNKFFVVIGVGFAVLIFCLVLSNITTTRSTASHPSRAVKLDPESDDESQPYDETSTPNSFHFFLNKEPFIYQHYLVLRAVRLHEPHARIVLHNMVEPSGCWWDGVKSWVEVHLHAKNVSGLVFAELCAVGGIAMGWNAVLQRSVADVRAFNGAVGVGNDGLEWLSAKVGHAAVCNLSAAPYQIVSQLLRQAMSEFHQLQSHTMPYVQLQQNADLLPSSIRKGHSPLHAALKTVLPPFLTDSFLRHELSQCQQLDRWEKAFQRQSYPYFGLNPIIKAPSEGFSIFVHDPVKCKYISASIIMTKYWEQGYTTKLLQTANQLPKATQEGYFLDVGSNLGWYTVYMASKGYKVIAVEPMEYNLELLRQSVLLNGYTDKIELHRCAVSDTAGGVACMQPAYAGDPEANQGNGQVVKMNNTCSCDVPILTLDGILEDKPIFAMKIDIEGYETLALRGAQRMLSDPQRKPCYMMVEYVSIYVQASGAPLMEIFENLMEKHQYSLWIGGNLITYEALRKNPPTYSDLVFTWGGERCKGVAST